MELGRTITRDKGAAFAESFSRIYALYSDRVYNLAYRMTGETGISEDITQETFIRAFSGLDKFRGESQISTWIYIIAKNACLRHIQRQGKRSFRSLEELIEKASLLASDETVDDQERRAYIHQIKDGCLLAILRCLSFNQRIAFILNVLFELPIADVSAILNKSENSVRILVHRSRKSVRDFLCKNCSLYDSKNKCKCSNLISFSLKQGWLERYSPSIPPETIEAELKGLKSEISFYRTLSTKRVNSDLRSRILNTIKTGGLRIFSHRKVK